MKKVNTIIIIVLLATATANAQEEVTLYAKKVPEGETPQAIVDAVKKDFPESAQAVQYYLNPDEMVDSEWGQALHEKIREGNHEYYTVQMKGSNGGYIYGLYDSEGELEVLKMEANNFALPQNIVTASTTGRYEGYKITSNKYKCYKVIDKRTNDEYIQVEIEKGKDNKTLFYTAQGEFIKEKG
jgi:hypothetical protein